MKFLSNKYSLFLLALLFYTNISAQNLWVGGASGNWNAPANWSFGQVPISTDDVKFTTNAIVALDVNTTVKSMEVQGPSGTDVVINAAGGTSLTIDGADINSAGLRLDEGNFELGAGINLTIRNNVNSGIIADNSDTLINYGTIYIEDFEAVINENDDGILINNGSWFVNYGTLTIDDLTVQGGSSSYMLHISNGSTFINAPGATYKAVTTNMAANTINRDALFITGAPPLNSSVVNDGIIDIGIGDQARIQRHGINNISGNFINNNIIKINGVSGNGIVNDGINGVFINNGSIDIDNVNGDGIINQDDSEKFENNASIIIGNGLDLNIVSQGIRNKGVFDNHATITINGTDSQAIYNADGNANFTNHSTGVITIDNISSIPLQNGDGNSGGLFTNDGGLININQNANTIRDAGSILFNNDDGTFINQNGGVINLDINDNDGLRSEAKGLNAFINRGENSIINIGALELIGNDGAFDDGIVADGNIRNEDGATINVYGANGRGIILTTLGNFTNDNGIVNVDNCLEHGLSIDAENGNKFLNTGSAAIFNIGQNTSVGDGDTDDNGVRCEGNFVNSNGATFNIDNVFSGFAIDLGAETTTGHDTLINDGGIINISQNAGIIEREYNIRVRDTCVLHNLNGGVINISNVKSYGIHFAPETAFINSGTINITDFEMTSGGSSNALYIADAISWHNDGILRVNDPSISGFLTSHAIYARNTPITTGPNSNIIVIDNSMTSGKIGGSAIYIQDCTVDNAGAITIGNGQSDRINSNGLFLSNSPYTSTSTSSITVNGLPVNTNAIFITGGHFNNAGNIDIDNCYRGIYCSSNIGFFNNDGAIFIGDGLTANMGSFGIFNQTHISNAGSININGTTADGIRSAHPNASFLNTGTVTIDNSAANGFTNGLGGNNPSPLTNAGGTIDIGLNGPIANIGLFIDDAGSMLNTNGGIITLSNSSQVLQNEANNGNQLLNNNCAVINLQGDFTNHGIFQNEAILNIQSGFYTYTNNIVNNGYIQQFGPLLNVIDRTAGLVSGIENMGTFMSNHTLLCPNESVEDILISESTNLNSLTFPTSTDWFFDNQLTTLAGSFDVANNSFSYATVPATTSILRFDVDGPGPCTFVGRVRVVVLDDPSCSEDCPFNVSITTNPNNLETISAVSTVNTVGPIVIGNTNTVVVKAGAKICLEPGFEVQLGGEFDAKIEDCSSAPLPDSNEIKE